ncbi:unnamed protein product [Scytosiphon promiscuus]
MERSMANRRRAFCEDSGLRELCEANGLTENAFIRQGHVLSSLDLFMSGLRDLGCLGHFGGLTAICFINVPNITSVSGLDMCCPGLTNLNITECGLETTRGLEGLTGLTALHLSSNNLQSLDGVRGMTGLRKLWANDNRIKSMDGLSALDALEDLWLCRNRLTNIGDGLPLGRTLREVHLAHNRLGCFKELLKLAPLEGLRSLTLQDIHFGDNPVCGLSNYKTYVAYHLTQQLTSLDMEGVPEESKAFANTVFLKKSMYYNMRSRIVKRHAGHVIRKARACTMKTATMATELCGEKAANLQTTLIHLQWQRKHVEQCLMARRAVQETGGGAEAASTADGTTRDGFYQGVPLISPVKSRKDGCLVAEAGNQNQTGGTAKTSRMEAEVNTPKSNRALSLPCQKENPEGLEVLQLIAKGQALSSAVVVVEGVLHKMEEQASEWTAFRGRVFKEVVGRACKRAVSELMLEFDTGGNVRFEEGRPGDVWFSSCADLVKSRVMISTGKGSAHGVKVSRVIRIHNRFLKNRFERCVREATAGGHDRSEPEPKPWTAATAAASAGPAKCTPMATSLSSEGSLGYPPPLPRRFDTSGVDSAPAGSSVIGGSDQRLRGEGSGFLDANGEVGVSCGGTGLPANGNVWRSSPLPGIPQQLHACRSNGGDGDKLCPTNGPSDLLGYTNTAAVAADDDFRLADDANSSAGITAPTGNLANSEKGGRESDGGNTVVQAAVGAKRVNKRSSTSPSSQSSSLRSLEYLFFTGRRGGTAGVSRAKKRRRPGGEGSNNGGKYRGDAACDEPSDSFSHERWQPDLLKLAEDGFSLPDWNETDVATGASEMASNAEGPSSSGAAWTSAPASQRGAADIRAGVMRGKSHRDSEKEDEKLPPASPPRSIVLSSHLTEVDIPSMSAQSAEAAAAEDNLYAAAAYAPSASIGLRSRELASPVCRVLVAKVYTGRTRRVPHAPSSGDGSRGRGGSGTGGGIAQPGLLRHAWAAGCKSVCVGGEDGEGEGAGGDERGGEEGSCSPETASSRCQEWHVLDGALTLPEYIIEFDFAPDMGKDGQAIKDGVRQRVNKWRRELAPSFRSSSHTSRPSSSSTSSVSSNSSPLPAATSPPTSSAAKPAGTGKGSGSGRASGGTDVLPFLIPLARLARQLEIDAAFYSARYETGISNALGMQPSAPVLGIPPGSQSGSTGCGPGSSVRDDNSPAVAPGGRLDQLSTCDAAAARPGHLLTRLSLHGQGVRKIEGLEACPNLSVLILSFNEVSRLDGLAGLTRLRHLDLGYNIIEGVQRYHGTSSPQAAPDSGGGEGGDPITATDHHMTTTGCTERGQSRGVSEEASRTAAFDTTAVALDVAAVVAMPRGGEEEAKHCSLSANVKISLPSLTRLDLNNNILHDLDDLKALWNIAPSLSVLDLRGNPFRAARTYRGAAIRGIPGLELLDGRSVTHKETSLHNACRSLTLDMLRRNGRRRAPRSAPQRLHERGGRQVALSRQDEAYRSRQPMDLDSSDTSRNRTRDSSNSTTVEERPPARGRGDRRRSASGVGTVTEDRNVIGSNDAENASGRYDSASGELEEEEDEKPGNTKRCSSAISSPRPSTPSMTPSTSSWDKDDTRIATAAGNIASSGGDPSGSGRPRSAPAAGNTGRNLSSIDNNELGENGALDEVKSGRGDIDANDVGAKDSGPSQASPVKLLLEDIELVNLHNLSLHKLEGMERLVFLRVADLSGNELHDTTPLGLCACLEELNLEGNELTTAGLRGLVGLRRLTKLDLGYNQISDLHPLRELTGLSQLSLESNLLHNLRGLTKLVNLMELYCGNNDIATASEMDRLRSLPRLIILDTTGNPVCSSPHFRLLVLFKIPTLKVLDGVGVGGTEKNDAKLKFVGKLTEEVIFDMYSKDKVEMLKYLDLSKSKWRSVEILPTLPFRSLQELNLDNNSLVSFAALGDLRSLGVLRLSYNRIDSIGQVEDDICPRGESLPAGDEPMFARLEVLYLGFNRINEISALGLERMPHLLAVDLQGNNIGSLGGLNRCRTLVEVNLDGNKIRQLGPPSALNGLGNLRKLRLEDNGLRVLSPGLGSSTPALLSLSLAQNRLSDPSELDRLGALPNLMELSVCGNPMARRPYSRLALLSLFPSLAAVDSTDITPEEKRLSEAMAGGSTGVGIVTAPSNANSSGAWGLAIPGISAGGSGGTGNGSGVCGAVSSVGEYVSVGSVGGITRKSMVATQGGGMGGYPTGSSAQSFSPFRPHDSLPPPTVIPGASSRGGTFSSDRGGKVSSGEDCLVPALMLKLKSGPASPGALGAVDGGSGGGDTAMGGHHRCGGVQPHHGSAKWAPPWTTRRIGSGGGPKRPLKLTSMNFSASPVGENERSGPSSRGASRRVSSLGGITGVNGDSDGTTNAGDGEKSRTASLATLDVGTRASATLPYGKIASLPARSSGIGLVRGRYDR